MQIRRHAEKPTFKRAVVKTANPGPNEGQENRLQANAMPDKVRYHVTSLTPMVSSKVNRAGQRPVREHGESSPPVVRAEVQPFEDQVLLGQRHSHYYHTDSRLGLSDFIFPAVAAVATGALGYFAGSSLGGAAAVAGAISGGIGGATILSTIGLMSDSHKSPKGTTDAAKGLFFGGALGAALGGFIGLNVMNPVVGLAAAAVGGLSAFVLAALESN